MKGQTHGGKGSSQRARDEKSWQNSKLWASIDKKKLKKSTQKIIEVKQKDER